jgi:hypothetical protein
MEINDTLAFIKGIQSGSFPAAAGPFRLPKTTVGRRMREHKPRSGAQLLHRTTRHHWRKERLSPYSLQRMSMFDGSASSANPISLSSASCSSGLAELA